MNDNDEGNILIELLSKRAINKKSAVRITGDVSGLLNRKRVKQTKDGRIFLSRIGEIVALGEYTLRKGD